MHRMLRLEADLPQSTNATRKASFMTTKSTRDHLLDECLGLMHGHGYNATGLTEILKAANVPKGSFYHHFGSKEDFAAAVLQRYIAHEDMRRRCSVI